MPFSRFLSTHYDIQVEEKIRLDDKEGYKQGNQIYFITSALNKETIYMEQAAIAYFLRENGYHDVAIPIVNVRGEWFTKVEDQSYLVIQIEFYREDEIDSVGIRLAGLHQLGEAYQYQPREISSYGNWRTLWIDKLTAFESKLEDEANKNSNAYYRLWMDTLPYVIGISENAIQYVRESETERRFNEVDQGTFCFYRFSNQLNKSVIFGEDLVFDHAARDIAEAIRNMYMRDKTDEQITSFISDYQIIRPLSIFSWRLIYSRLLFPAPFFDLMNKGFFSTDFDILYKELEGLLVKQSKYEKRLQNFYEKMGLVEEIVDIPMIHWL
ncbi:hypothetical protein D8M04_04630 [Oceanobacillus piezotolerans]|uniref:Spore coat protein YutH n=1 Tax=Oceanobacillus piezotolerans TaxID=2448030 RepID=A0A498DC12_9BACI|nr:hypothetical protein [Oceanobacillus piezotolerans]RLL46497.1 hypothetical protein D8M04_04630 [Oceanobacillus piezotolerans]